MIPHNAIGPPGAPKRTKTSDFSIGADEASTKNFCKWFTATIKSYNTINVIFQFLDLFFSLKQKINTLRTSINLKILVIFNIYFTYELKPNKSMTSHNLHFLSFSVLHVRNEGGHILCH